MNENIKPASFNKRIFSYLVDCLIVVVTTLILFFSVTSNFMFSALGGNEAYQKMYSYELESGLFAPSYNDGQLSGATSLIYTPAHSDSQAQDGYDAYFDKVFAYYKVFLPTNAKSDKTGKDGTVYGASDFVSYFELNILHLPDPSTISDVTNESQIQQIVSTDTGLSAAYFKYAVNGGKVDPLSRPVLTSAYQSLVSSGDTTTLASLNSYFYAVTSTSYSGVYYDALQDITGNKTSNYLVYQSYVYNLSLQASVDRWLCYLVLYVPLQLIVFVILPLCLKDGQTLGKKLFKLAVLSKQGYSASFFGKLGHGLCLFVLGLFLMWPNLLLGVMSYAILAMVDYLVLTASKDRRSLHDKMSGTQVVDAVESKWFASAAAEKRYYALNPQAAAPVSEPTPSEKLAQHQLEAEDSILDLSTMNKNREEAAKMTSFDEFEKWSDEQQEQKASEAPAKKVSVNLHKEEEPKEPSKK
jgi:uncharacterized RDD family membrane protein YckC